MIHSPVIFDDLRPLRRSRRRDPQSSHLAADNSAKFAGTHAGRIMAAMRKWGGDCPTRTIAISAGLTTVQVDRRLHELESLGYIERVMGEFGEPAMLDGYGLWRLTHG